MIGSAAVASGRVLLASEVEGACRTRPGAAEDTTSRARGPAELREGDAVRTYGMVAGYDAPRQRCVLEHDGARVLVDTQWLGQFVWPRGAMVEVIGDMYAAADADAADDAAGAPVPAAVATNASAEDREPSSPLVEARDTLGAGVGAVDAGAPGDGARDATMGGGALHGGLARLEAVTPVASGATAGVRTGAGAGAGDLRDAVPDVHPPLSAEAGTHELGDADMGAAEGAPRLMRARARRARAPVVPSEEFVEEELDSSPRGSRDPFAGLGGAGALLLRARTARGVDDRDVGLHDAGVEELRAFLAELGAPVPVPMRVTGGGGLPGGGPAAGTDTDVGPDRGRGGRDRAAAHGADKARRPAGVVSASEGEISAATHVEPALAVPSPVVDATQVEIATQLSLAAHWQEWDAT